MVSSSSSSQNPITFSLLCLVFVIAFAAGVFLPRWFLINGTNRRTNNHTSSELQEQKQTIIIRSDPTSCFKHHRHRHETDNNKEPSSQKEEDPDLDHEIDDDDDPTDLTIQHTLNSIKQQYKSTIFVNSFGFAKDGKENRDQQEEDLFITDKFLGFHAYENIYERYLKPWKVFMKTKKKKERKSKESGNENNNNHQNDNVLSSSSFRYFEIGLGCLPFYSPRGPGVGQIPSGLGYLFIKNYIPEVDYYGLDVFSCNFTHLGKEHQDYCFPPSPPPPQTITTTTSTLNDNKRILTTFSSDEDSIRKLMKRIRISGGGKPKTKSDDYDDDEPVFDFIVDDGSHLSYHNIESFLFLFRHGLRPSASSSSNQKNNNNNRPPSSVYCIEDLSASWTKMGTGSPTTTISFNNNIKPTTTTTKQAPSSSAKQLNEFSDANTIDDVKKSMTAVKFVQTLMRQMMTLEEIFSRRRDNDEQNKKKSGNKYSTFRFLKIIEWIEAIECQREICFVVKRSERDVRLDRFVNNKMQCEGEMCVLEYLI